MKLEHIYLIIYLKIIKFLHFNYLFLTKLTIKIRMMYAKSWKISKFAETYWFIFSNRKTIYELRSTTLI